jgi:Transglycosylase SLT domain
MMGVACVLAWTGAHAAYQAATIEAMPSLVELKIRVGAVERTLRFPGISAPAACGLTSVARSLVPRGTAAKLLVGTDRTRVYLELGGELVEWVQVLAAAGFVTVSSSEQNLRDAQDEARKAKLGLWGGCAEEDVFARVARDKAVARPLLFAVALAESGRGGMPWPWTLNVEGRSYYYESREKAHDALVGFLKRGYTSIDVGYMQVNLAYNGQRFANTWQALDPYENIAAGAAILLENVAQSRNDVREAVGHYHSHTPWRASQYYTRVASIYAAQNRKETN